MQIVSIASDLILAIFYAFMSKCPFSTTHLTFWCSSIGSQYTYVIYNKNRTETQEKQK